MIKFIVRYCFPYIMGFLHYIFFLSDIMYKILDFDHGLGGLSNGMEIFGDFEVIGAPWLNEKTNLCYNLNHKNLFEIGVYDLHCDYDIALFNPYFGDNFLRRGSNNFDFSEINQVIDFLKSSQPDYAIISTKPEVVQYLGNVELPTYTADNWPVYDYICFGLKDYYRTFQFVIDGAEYGIPQHKKMNFYLCVHKKAHSADFSIPAKTHSIKKGFVTIQNAIGDIEGNDYGVYSSNFIDFCRQDKPRLTWHECKFEKQKQCSYIQEGGSAKTTKELTQKTGYIRPKYHKICPNLDFEFYKLSSKRASLHPIVNRPFTIREGARLFGLPDTYVWNNNLKKHEIALMIYNSISPIFGKVIIEILNSAIA